MKNLKVKATSPLKMFSQGLEWRVKLTTLVNSIFLNTSVHLDSIFQIRTLLRGCPTLAWLRATHSMNRMLQGLAPTAYLPALCGNHWEHIAPCHVAVGEVA